MLLCHTPVCASRRRRVAILAFLVSIFRVPVSYEV